MKTGDYCSRKGGATIAGKFHPLPRTTAIMAEQFRKKNQEAELRLYKRMKKRGLI